MWLILAYQFIGSIGASSIPIHWIWIIPHPWLISIVHHNVLRYWKCQGTHNPSRTQRRTSHPNMCIVLVLSSHHQMGKLQGSYDQNHRPGGLRRSCDASTTAASVREQMGELDGTSSANVIWGPYGKLRRVA